MGVFFLFLSIIQNFSCEHTPAPKARAVAALHAHVLDSPRGPVFFRSLSASLAFCIFRPCFCLLFFLRLFLFPFYLYFLFDVDVLSVSSFFLHGAVKRSRLSHTTSRSGRSSLPLSLSSVLLLTWQSLPHAATSRK